MGSVEGPLQLAIKDMGADSELRGLMMYLYGLNPENFPQVSASRLTKFERERLTNANLIKKVRGRWQATMELLMKVEKYKRAKKL